MLRFTETGYIHDSLPLTGILLTNLGTPDAPSTGALRRYLGEFLWDPRVVEIPRPLWWLILHGVILRVRPRRSAMAYAKIWDHQGSPLLRITLEQAQALREALASDFPGPVHIAVGMRYGQPAIGEALEQLRRLGVRRLLVLPLYPQYASATTGSTFDAVSAVLQGWRWLPELRFVPHYHDHPGYIAALAQSIESYWAQQGRPEKLLFSFHGIPKRTFLAGDPYHCECHKTARLVAEHLELPDDLWQVVFQSRFGREEWLQPYTDHTLNVLGKIGTPRVDVICPGFSADCLETLDEISRENRELFLQSGGSEFHYIPALNTDPAHIQALRALVLEHTQGWSECRTPQETLHQTVSRTRERASALGAER